MTDASDLRRTFVLANAFKEGDLPLGGTRDDRVRRDAREALLGITFGRIRRTTLVEDGVSEALARSLDRRLAADLDLLTVGQARDCLLRPDAAAWASRYRDGLGSEAIAAVVKVMTDDELSAVARGLFNPLPGAGVTVGSPRHFGARIQPNSPGDDEEEILFSILEGLAHGCGDVILGLNPASDDLDTIVRLEELLGRVVRHLDLPTRYCVLSDIVKQHRARERTRVDVGFQSLAGTSKAIRGMVGLDVEGVLDLSRSFDGLYFETGQGSAVTNGADEGVDMVTLESRAYGVARYIGEHATENAASAVLGRRSRNGEGGRRTSRPWMIVNDVAGFIGPEVFGTEEQLERACLEDAVMAKLHGLTMGLDVCSTFHMGIAPAALRRLTARIVERAAPAYLMAVAGNADPMLGYLTTSFREHPVLRRTTGRQMTDAMQRRLRALGVVRSPDDLAPCVESTVALYTKYVKEGGDTRSADAVADEGLRRLHAVRDRGYDLGYGCDAGHAPPPAVDARLDTIYTNARRALYAGLEPSVIEDACPRHVRARTLAADRDDYLAHPPSGEQLRDDDARVAAALYPARRPQVQVVVSDGLNANAINEHLRALLSPLRYRLAQAGCHVGDTDVVIEHARVRAGYHVGALVDATVVVHLIGERPGTGLNTMSAYVTYGRDAEGRSRWTPSLDHSWTTAVCGIHPAGKPPSSATVEIAGMIVRMIEQRCSGVALKAPQGRAPAGSGAKETPDR